MKQAVQYSCLFVAAYAAGAFAQPQTLPEIPEGDTFTPYVYTGATYDDNIFRVVDEQEAQEVSGDARMSDTVTRYGIGLRMSKPISLQTLRLDAAIERADYNHFDQLDHTAGAGLLAWDWEVGRLMDGTLSHNYTRGISRFTEFQQAVRDIRTVNLSHFSGGMNFLTAWRIELGGEARRVRYDEQTFLDRDEDMGFAQLLYATSVNTRVGLRAQHTDADLEPQPTTAGTPANNDYEENEYSLVVGWEGGAKSYLEARAGYTSRDQEDPAQNDFSGATGQLTHQWEITSITRLRTSIFRNTNALDYQIATFVVSDGATLEPSWQVTPDTRLVTRFGYRRDEFKGPVVTADGTVTDAGREDKVASAGAAVEYQAITDLLFRLAVDHSDRNSNRDDSDYDYTQVSAELSYAF